MLQKGIACVALVLLAASHPAGQATDSSELAKQLTAMVTAQHVDAVAAADPDAPDRFVAALVFPNMQLLVVSAKYPAPLLMLQQIGTKEYREAYLGLQQSGVREGKVFFQDMGGDGLRRDADTVDVLYENGGTAFLFDRAHRPRGLTDAAYQQKFANADARYARLLSLLLGQLKQASAAAKQ